MDIFLLGGGGMEGRVFETRARIPVKPDQTRRKASNRCLWIHVGLDDGLKANIKANPKQNNAEPMPATGSSNRNTPLLPVIQKNTRYVLHTAKSGIVNYLGTFVTWYQHNNFPRLV